MNFDKISYGLVDLMKLPFVDIRPVSGRLPNVLVYPNVVKALLSRQRVSVRNFSISRVKNKFLKLQWRKRNCRGLFYSDVTPPTH
ncbi:unnamed protein product, partial [Nesidiocoris tenuis]